MFADLAGDGWLDPDPLAGEVLQEIPYYPFGARFASASAVPIPAVPNDYRYNGKAYQDELGVNSLR